MKIKLERGSDITLGTALLLLSAIGYRFKGRYQREMLGFLLGNRKCLLLAARQAGKTEMISFVVALYVLFGHRCLIAMQTKTQGYDIFTERINYFLNQLARLFPEQLTRSKDQPGTRDRLDFVMCANGGGFKIISSDAKYKGNEGWTASVLIVDEAHMATDSFFGKVTPTQVLAVEGGYDKTIVSGVRGYRGSLIAILSDATRGFVQGVWDCYEIVKTRPTFQTVIDSFRQSMSEKDFAQYFELLAVTSGVRYVFEHGLPKALAIIPPGPVAIYAGIDIGRKRDSTIATAGRVYVGQALQVYGCLVIQGETFDKQAAKVVPWLRERGIPEPNTTIEANGIGQALIDAMAVYSMGYGWLSLSVKLKEWLITEASALARRGMLAIDDDTMRLELDGLTYRIKEDGSLEYEHSDYFSSLLMLMSSYLYGTRF